MKRVKLDDGSVVTVSILHTTAVLPEWGEEPARTTRATKVEVRETHPDGIRPIVEQGWAKVGRGDNFCRRTGRRVAANHLLANLRVIGWEKGDRRAVFLAICPEFA